MFILEAAQNGFVIFNTLTLKSDQQQILLVISTPYKTVLTRIKDNITHDGFV